MKELLMQPWGVMRIFRVVMGAYILVTSLLDQQYLFALIGGFFLYQGITNTGCAACAAPPAKDIVESEELTNEVTYEEIK